MPNVEVAIAQDRDLDGIVELQDANQIRNGGTLSAAFSRSQLSRLMTMMPVLVARRAHRVIGFLISSTGEFASDIPIVRAMFDSYPNHAPDSYVYGPVCVADDERGKGLAQLLFDELRCRLPRREGVLFVRSDNEASIRAHRRMGMSEVSRFSYNGIEHLVFAYVAGACSGVPCGVRRDGRQAGHEGLHI